MPKCDELCPQGFAPHSIRPTRCKRCFRGYEEHKKKPTEAVKPEGKDLGSSSSSTTTTTAKPEGKTTTTTATTHAQLPIPEIVIPISEEASHSNQPEPSTTTSVAPSSTATVFRRRRPDTTLKEDHGTKRPSSATDNLSAARRRTRTRPCSWSGSSRQTDGADNNDNLDDDDDDDISAGLSSPSSPNTRNRRVQIVSAKELRPSLVDESAEIPESASADVEFILRVKTSTAENLSKDRGQRHRSGGDDDDQDDSMSVAASTTTETTLSYHDSVEDMQATVQTLRRQVDDLQVKCRRLEADRERMQSTASEKESDVVEKTAAELLRLKAQVFELKTSNEELSDDNRVLRLETKELQDELTEVQHRAHQVEAKCEELANENSELKREMQDMEEEIDEMQDNFQDDQAGQFHDMRKNMEQLERNCRILQFKLRKSERRCEELEANSTDADDRPRTTSDADEQVESPEVREKVQRLEAEVRASRQVSSRLHAETEVLRAKLGRMEDQPQSNGGSVPMSTTEAKTEERPLFALPVQSDGDDSAQLIRELYDTVEREKDLKEQLRFSEEEASSLRKKLTSFEEENDSLVMQIKKMVGNRPTSKARRGDATSQSNQNVIVEDAEADQSAVEMKVQLDLVEQESKVLRKKMADMEVENERLGREIKQLEQKAKEATAAASLPQDRRSVPKTPKDATPSDTVLHYQQTILIMETEAKELRRKLIDKQRENEQLHSELGNYKTVRRGSRAPSSSLASMRRSASLDSDNETTTLDLRRQLQLLEQEATILRQRTLDLENENERLANNNRRLEMTNNTSKKQADAAGLKTPMTTSAAKLKEQVAKQEQEIAQLQQKIKELAPEFASKEVVAKSRSLPQVAAYRQKTPKKITENCTRPELRKYVIDLEEEIKQLAVTLGKKAGEVDKQDIAPETKVSKVDSECQTSEIHEFNLTAKEVELNKPKIKKKETVGLSTLPKSKAVIQESEVLKKKVVGLEKELAEETKKCGEMSKQLETESLVASAELHKLRTETDELRKEVLKHQKQAEVQKTLKRELESAQRELEAEKSKQLKTVDTSRPDLDLKAKLTDLQKKHRDLEKDIETKKHMFETKMKELEAEVTSSKEAVERKERDLEEANSQLKLELKRRERSERDYEAELRERDDDLNRLRDKNRKCENEIEKLMANKDVEPQSRIKTLERDLTLAKSENADLTSRYEALEEDYVIIKAQLVESETQYSEGQLVKNLRETFNLRQDTWIKEKLDMQEKLKELSVKLTRANTTSWDLEKDLKNAVEEKILITERMKKSELALKDEMEQLRRQVEDAKSNVLAANTAGEGSTSKEIQDLKNKLRQEERNHRSEVSSSKLRYDQHLTAYQNEIQALHLQNSKFRRERDAYGLMMKGAQEKIADLKMENSTSDQVEAMRTKMEQLQQEKEDAVDKMDLAERNCSRLKTEFAVERSSCEIRISELQTKINELEEANVLQGAGKSRIVGVKSRLELAWQKERDEQRRLLTDAKRQLEDLRNHMGNDQTHTQAKIHELQEDLVQLRDAHSKMRSFNDRVRRDKDRIERERDELRTFLGRTQQLSVHERKSVMDLAEEMQKIQLMVPTVLGVTTLPKSSTFSSTSSNATRVQQDEDIKEKFKSSLKRISSATEELRKVHGAKEEDRMRRNLSFRKALSEDEDRSGSHVPSPMSAYSKDDPLSRWQNPQRVTNYPASPPSMYISPHSSRHHNLFRKSLSLDQSFGDPSLNLWRSSVEGDTSDGSSASLMSGVAPTPSPRLKKHLRRARQLGGSSLEGSDVSATTSMSSRETSAEPSQRASDINSDKTNSKMKRPGGMKRSLLKRLTKSKSVEETPTAGHIKQVGMQALTPGLGSSSSVSEAAAPVASARETKMGKDLKSRIANLFKKSSRSNSVDMGTSSSSQVGASSGTSTLSHDKDKPSTADTKLHKRYGSTSVL